MIRVVWAVEKVDVDAILVVCGADRRDGCESGCGLLPFVTRHAAGVVDQEDSVECGEESIGVVCTRSGGG